MKNHTIFLLLFVTLTINAQRNNETFTNDILTGYSISNDKTASNKSKACQTVNFNQYDAGVYTPFSGTYNCSNYFRLAADYTGIDPKLFQFITPGWAIQFDLDAKGGTDNYVNVRRDGQSPYSTNFTQGRNNNSTWIIAASFSTPTSRYEIQLCDVSGDGTIPYRIYNIYGTQIGSGSVTFTTPGQCSNWIALNTTDLPGTAVFTGPGITSFSNGTAWWDAAVAGPGTHTIQYCWNDGGTCSSCTTKTVTVVGPTANAGADKYVCTGGSVSIGGSPTASGGATPYVYSWSPSTGLSSTTDANPTANPNNTTDYIVVVKDDNGDGCIARDTVRVRVNKINISTETKTNIACYGQNTGSISVSATYSESQQSPLSYSLGTPQGNGNFTGLAAGTYTVTISDAQSCTLTRSYDLTAPTQLTVNATGTNATCGVANGSATASASGGMPTYIYSWSNGSTGTTISNVSAGNYTITVTDANLCTATTNVSINNTGAPIASIDLTTHVSCFGGSNGGATASATGGATPYTYSWSTGSTTNTQTGLSAGNVTVSVIDNSGCVSTASANITQPNQLTATPVIINNVNCNGANDGSASVTVSGGTTAYTYSWSNSSSSVTISALSPATYTVTITDSKSCVATASTTITEPQKLTASISVISNVTCNGGNNGSASVTVTGGTTAYTYSWTNSSTNNSITNLVANTYTVTVSDSKSCIAIASTTITQPTALSINITKTDAACGASNGSATASASGGASAFTYIWSNGTTGTTINNIAAGTYTVTATDANNCTITSNANISNLGGPTATLNIINNISCYGGNDGSASVLATGGTTPYTYTWSSGSTTNTQTQLSVGNISVTVSDNSNCIATASGTITQPNQLNAVATIVNNISCYGGNNGSASVTVSGGTTNYTYSWSNNSTLVSTSGLSASTYTVTVIDSKSCLTTSSITLTNPTEINLTVTGSNPTLAGVCNGTATATGSGGTGTYTYTWNNTQNTQTATNLCGNSTYTVTINDGNGCTKTGSVTIGSSPNLILTVNTSNPLCYGICNGGATAQTINGTSPYTYLWSGSNVTTAVINSLCGNTNYTVTVTDNNSQTATASISLVYPDSLNIQISVTNSPCISSKCESSATAVINGGVSPYIYLWNNGKNATTAEPSELCGDESYILTVTDANNCTKTTSITIGSCLEIPSAFTPNADGKNDHWTIRGIEYFPEVTIKIYNRWGQTLFDFTGDYSKIDNCWDGTYKGKKLPLGAYIYIIDFKNELLKPMQGTVTIIR